MDLAVQVWSVAEVTVFGLLLSQLILCTQAFFLHVQMGIDELTAGSNLAID